MTAPRPDGEQLTARMPVDVDAPDKVLYGLTFHQVAVLSVAAVVLYAGWSALHRAIPVVVLMPGLAVVGVVAFAVAVGRRDGRPLDAWLVSAVQYRRAPRALSTTDTATAVPAWVTPVAGRVPVPAPLRLPADAIDDDGQIRLTGSRTTVGLVAAGTVNLGLRTPAEQAALVEAFGRWCNSLTTRTQITVSAQPVDLHRHATALAEAAPGLTHPALEAACADHARYLTELAEHRDPLRRQVLVSTTTAAAGPHAARRAAEDTARALSGLGVTTRVLDAPAVTAALAAAADPYRPPRPAGLAAPDTAITTSNTRTHTRPRTRGRTR